MRDLAEDARIGARSARMLLEAGDYKGAVNRAYYAMFNLARHALRTIEPKLAAAKKHSTIIGRFSKYVVHDRSFPREAGEALRKAFDARLLADYSDTAPTLEQATAAIQAMERFFEILAAGEGSSRP